MATKNKSFASKALLEMDDITSAIKEESKKSLTSFLNEAVKNALRESCNEDDDYEIEEDEDGKKDEKNPNDAKKSKKNVNSKKSTNEDGNQEMNDMENYGELGQQVPNQNPNPQIGRNQEMEPNGASPEEMDNGQIQGQDIENMDGKDSEPEGEEGEEGWNDFEKYKVGDNTYDLTGENDYDSVVKVYKLLNDEDQVVIKQDGDSLHLKDNEAGTEYVIDLGSADDEAADEAEGEEQMPDGNLNEEFFYEDDDDDFMAGLPDEDEDEYEDFDEFGDYPYDEDELDDFDIYSDDENESDLDFENDDEFDDEEFDDEYHPEIYENKRNKKKPMKESKKVLFEVDLGYTDNYQDKDPIAGLSNNEPAKGMKSWHKGVPTGTKKPWAGDTKSNGEPFKNTQKVQGSVNEEDMVDNIEQGSEMEEQKNVGGFVQQNSVTASNIPNSNGRKARSQRGTDVKVTGSADPRYSSATNESKELKSIKNENKELKKAILELRKNLNEAYITNVNLGKITKLFLENATSQEEKADIVNRFTNEAKTIEQSNTLYESIDKQLKKKQQINLNESSATANGTKELNEQKIYKSNDLLKTIDLMGRVLNC